MHLNMHLKDERKMQTNVIVSICAKFIIFRIMFSVDKKKNKSTYVYVKTIYFFLIKKKRNMFECYDVLTKYI